MAPPKVMNGARAKVGFYNPNTGKVDFVGLFTSISYNVTYDMAPAFILGRYSAAEIDYTAMEPVNVSMSGWRVIEHGPHKTAQVPKLQDLLQHEYLTIVVADRATGKDVATIRKFRPGGYGTSINSRNLEEISVSGMGLLVDDEDTQNAEATDSLSLP